jgi:cysteinyl-tRNA synthetase
MSKSEGNFYTLRDLLLKGYRASAIRLALISVPYRHQYNFTFDGLVEATATPSSGCGPSSQRLVAGSLRGWFETRNAGAAKKAQTDYRDALNERLEHCRGARADLRPAARSQYGDGPGELKASDREAILAVLASFDAVFDVMEDHDAEATRHALQWAEQTGRMSRG